MRIHVEIETQQRDGSFVVERPALTLGFVAHDLFKTADDFDVARNAVAARGTRHGHLGVNEPMQIRRQALHTAHAAEMAEIDGLGLQRADALNRGVQGVGVEFRGHGRGEYERTALDVQLAIRHAEGVTGKERARSLIPQADVVARMARQIEHPQHTVPQRHFIAFGGGDDALRRDRLQHAIQRARLFFAIDTGVGLPQAARINHVAHATRMHQQARGGQVPHQPAYTPSVIKMDMGEYHPRHVGHADSRLFQRGEYAGHRGVGAAIHDCDLAAVDDEMDSRTPGVTGLHIHGQNAVRMGDDVLHEASLLNRGLLCDGIDARPAAPWGVLFLVHPERTMAHTDPSDSFNFDSIADRHAVPGDKWGRYAGRDVLPLWVADMDFRASPAILNALHERIEHGIFGYTAPWPSLVEAVLAGIARDHDWQIEPDWLVWLPGVVTGFNLACRITGRSGTSVFTATPVYPPFLAAPALNDRRLITRPLMLADGRWQWDRAAVDAAQERDTRLFMLCNPHNPCGRVFDRDELEWIADLALRHDQIVCADEIHCGLVLDDEHTHRPIAALDEAIAQRTITLMAPSKTWNIPALYCAFAIIPDATLRERFRRAMRGIVPAPNVLGLIATEAAYRDGHDWRLELLQYLRANRALVAEAVGAMPGVSMIAPEATYLAWIDCRASGLDDPAQFFETHGVGLSDGADFGLSGFVRLNFGCPRATLNEALTRMRHALERHHAA